MLYIVLCVMVLSPPPLFPQIRYLGSQSERDGPCPVVHVFMEYAQGGSLSDVLRRYGALAERVVAVYTKQILRGLRYLHEHGMAHRDIKGASYCDSKPLATHTHTEPK